MTTTPTTTKMTMTNATAHPCTPATKMTMTDTVLTAHVPTPMSTILTAVNAHTPPIMIMNTMSDLGTVTVLFAMIAPHTIPHPMITPFAMVRALPMMRLPHVGSLSTHLGLFQIHLQAGWIQVIIMK
ncbi:hypothetical protein FRC11_007605 [Ceratobasidium sp. 423]|nr:hypothetical protein FRC11_007605 [Ceratobasidium sp. 423]